MRRRADGFTLVELLVASSVLVALLAALGSLFVSSSRAYESNRGASSAAANLRSAVHALRYDVSMAGFRGLDGDAAEREIVTPLVVTLAGADVTNDSSWPIAEITARFVETRYTQGAPTVREVTYRVRNGALERREGADGAYVVIAAGIVDLRLVRYRREGTTTAAPSAAVPADLTGLDLRIVYRHGTAERAEDLSVSLLNRP
jgi:prepilin-type N-terminal cleavage/methylation domain-containing protein